MKKSNLSQRNTSVRLGELQKIKTGGKMAAPAPEFVLQLIKLLRRKEVLLEQVEITFYVMLLSFVDHHITGHRIILRLLLAR